VERHLGLARVTIRITFEVLVPAEMHDLDRRFVGCDPLPAKLHRQAVRATDQDGLHDAGRRTARRLESVVVRDTRVDVLGHGSPFREFEAYDRQPAGTEPAMPCRLSFVWRSLVLTSFGWSGLPSALDMDHHFSSRPRVDSVANGGAGNN
jgi:hypothetical protein